MYIRPFMQCDQLIRKHPGSAYMTGKGKLCHPSHPEGINDCGIIGYSSARSPDDRTNAFLSCHSGGILNLETSVGAPLYHHHLADVHSEDVLYQKIRHYCEQQ